MATDKKTTLVKKKTTTSLPSLKVLFQDSWELFHKTILLYGKLLGLNILISLGIILVSFILSIPLFYNLIQTHGNLLHQPTPFVIGSIIFSGLVALVAFVALIICGLVFTVAQLLIFKHPQGASVRSLLGQSRGYLKRLFLGSLLVAFLSMGGYFVLIIPGMIINFFLMFTNLEIILENQPIRKSILRSYHIVKSNFWPLLGRFLLIEVLFIVAQTVIDKVLGNDGILSFVAFVANVAMTWFFLVYFYTMYRQAKSRTTTTTAPSSSITWMWVLACLGWILLIIGIVSLWHFLPTLMHSPLFNPKAIPTGTV